MLLNVNGQELDIEYIRVHRSASITAFFALVNDEWTFFYKFGDKRLPTYKQFRWPNPRHMFGWSRPYRLEQR